MSPSYPHLYLVAACEQDSSDQVEWNIPDLGVTALFTFETACYFLNLPN